MAENLSPIADADLIELCQLAKSEGGNRRLTPEFVRWWYFNNPVGKPLLMKLTAEDRIEGYVTTNQFPFRIDGKSVQVAMPQNVLTSSRMRGKGWFRRLYLEIELANERSGVHDFLTFTNTMSTPIFLEKFGYRQCADVGLWFTWVNPLRRLKKGDGIREVSLNEVVWHAWRQPTNGMEKTEVYLRWRYERYTANELRILALHDDQGRLAYAVLKRHRAKGMPVWLLMELFFLEGADRGSLLEQIACWSSTTWSLGVLHFSMPGDQRVSGSWLFRQRFNLLSKGPHSHLAMEWVWGDLDIV